MIHERDILLYAGGAALQKYGSLVWRKQIPQFGGEELQETFARTGPGSYTTRGGLVKSAAAATPRVEWVDVDGDGEREGYLLLEGVRTNQLTYSEQFGNPAWATIRAGISGNQHVAPDGATTADRLIEDTSNNSHYITQSAATATANAVYALTVFAKDVGGGRNWIVLRLVENGNYPNHVRAFFNLATGDIGASAGAGTGSLSFASIEPLADGWYRCIVVGSVGNSATAIDGRVYLAESDNTDGYLGDGSSYVAIWGMQFEDNAREPSSYIATTTAAASRPNEDWYSDWPFAPQAMCGYKRFRELEAPNFSNNQRLSQIGSASASVDPSLFLHKTSGDDTYRVRYDDAAGGSVGSVLDLAPSYGDLIELRWTIAENGAVQLHGAKNGGAENSGVESAALALPSAWAGSPTPRFYLNGVNGNVVGFAGHIADIVVRAQSSVPSMDDFRALLP